MAKQLPLDKVLASDIAGKPIHRGDFLLYGKGDSVYLGIVKKGGSSKGYVKIVKLVGYYGWSSSELFGRASFVIPQQAAVTILTKAKLEGGSDVCSKGVQVMEVIERQRAREEKNKCQAQPIGLENTSSS